MKKRKVRSSQKGIALAVLAIIGIAIAALQLSFAQAETIPVAPTIVTAVYSTENLGQREVRLTITTNNATNQTYNQLYWRLQGTSWPSPSQRDTYNSSTWTQPANVGGIQIGAPTVSGTYEYQLQACNSAGCSSSNSISVSVPGTTTASAAPSSLLLDPAPTANTIYLKWTDNSSDETFFAIDRKFVSDGSYAGTLHWGTTGANITTFADTNVVAGQHYDYRVRACKGTSGAANEVCSDSINRSDAVTLSAPTSCTALSLTVDKSSYVKGDNVNYTYACSTPTSTTVIQQATVQVVKPTGPMTYVSGSNVTGPMSLGFSTSNLDAGAYTLRVCLDTACTASGMASWAFAVTNPANTSTTTIYSNPNWVRHTWTFKDGATDSSNILARSDSDYLAYITSVDTLCRTFTRSGTTTTWKAGSGTETNWQEFGIPNCSGTGTTSTTTTTTTTTTPPTTTTTTTPGSCSTGTKCAKGSWCSNGSKCFYPDSQIMCVAYSTGYAAASNIECPAGTTVCDPSDSSCVAPGQIVPYVSGKWCNQGQSYYSTDGKNMTCVSWSTTAPAGFSTCRPGDTSCIPENGYGPSTGYCTNAMKCYQKASDTDSKNDVFCAKMPMPAAGTTMMTASDVMCPSGYSLCSPTDASCKQKGDTWTDKGSYTCMSSQKCSTSTGGTCVGWSETCPTGSKYCSATDTNCIEPGEYKAIASTTATNSTTSYWCGGGNGMVFYSATQAYCEKKLMSATTTAAMMWTDADVKAVIAKLGAGWGFCAPGNTNCIEPGKTGPATGWCGWMPPMSAGNYSNMNTATSGTRTCPALDGVTVVTPPKTTCPLAPAIMCAIGLTAQTSINADGCSVTVCVAKPNPKICPLISPIICPAGQITRSSTNADGCSTTWCSSDENQMRECALGEMPMGANMCMMPKYRWNIAQKKFEKCDKAAAALPYVTVQGNSAAKYTNCQPVNSELDIEWQTRRNLVHPPEKDGEWYNPPWNSGDESLQYNPETDQFGKCENRYQTAAPMAPGSMPMYTPPCTPVPDVDMKWMLLKARAEYKMFKLWSAQKIAPQPLVQKLTPDVLLPAEPVDQVLPTDAQTQLEFSKLLQPVVPTALISAAQCNAYTREFKNNFSADKAFYKDAKRAYDQAVGYSDAAAVKALLDSAKDILNSVNATLTGKCDKDSMTKLREQFATLHTDIFSDLNSSLGDIRYFAEASQCRARLTKQKVKLMSYLKSAGSEEKRDSLQTLINGIDAKIKENVETKDVDYDAVDECTSYEDELDSEMSGEILFFNHDIQNVIDTIVNKKLESVMGLLKSQQEESGKTIESLLVKIAGFTAVLDSVKADLATSYAQGAQIPVAHRAEIQTTKDRLVTLANEVAPLLSTCSSGATLEKLRQYIGNVAVYNWVPEVGNDVERGVQVLATACKGGITQEDVTGFTVKFDQYVAQNAQLSYSEGITPSADVPSHAWYYVAYQKAYDAGYVTQGRPADTVIAQDALLMVLRATGASGVDGSCTLDAGSTVRNVSPYAACAVNLAQAKGLNLRKDMTTPISRSGVAEWIAKLTPEAAATTEATLSNVADIAGVPADLRTAIGKVIATGIMTGEGTAGANGKINFNPTGTLTRAALVVIVERLGAR